MDRRISKDDLKLLIEAKLSARSPRKGPLLKKRHVQNRLKSVAKEHIDWPKKKLYLLHTY
uniref:Uncharacterized protein n=1 Tax=Cyprinus carpio TaxID=7962 RepID=A0A8C1PLU4_CYPCA